jgi:hypothetical protein
MRTPALGGRRTLESNRGARARAAADTAITAKLHHIHISDDGGPIRELRERTDRTRRSSADDRSHNLVLVGPSRGDAAVGDYRRFAVLRVLDPRAARRAV